MRPEFLGIYLIYLYSRISAWRGLTVMMSMLFSVALGVVFWKDYQLDQVYREMSRGNHIECDEGYLAKIVEGGKVTCIMSRIGPGVSTRKERR